MVQFEILLWKVLSKFGCQPHILLILQEFYNSMKAKMVVGDRMSNVLIGVIVFWPLWSSTASLSPLLWPSGMVLPVSFIYRLDGSLFNIRRLTAETNNQGLS